jgi:hypothetical protein
MKLSLPPPFSLLSLPLALALAAPVARAWQALPPATVAAPPATALRFSAMPLGNVARVLSARYCAPVTITAHATAPVTGDFSGLSLRQALTAAARQAGLMLVPMGATDSAGFSLSLPSDAAPSAPAPAAASPKSSSEAQGDLAQAQRRREQLFRQRAALLDAAAQLDQ